MTTRPSIGSDNLISKRQKIRQHAGNFFELMTLVDPEAIAKMKEIARETLLKPLIPQITALNVKRGEEMKALTGTRANAAKTDKEAEEEIEKIQQHLAKLIELRITAKDNYDVREEVLVSRMSMLDTSIQALQDNVDKAVKMIEGTFTPTEYSAADGLLALASSSPSSSSSSPETPEVPHPSKPTREVIEVDDLSSSFPSLEEPCVARPDYTIQNMEDEVILLPMTDKSPAPVPRSGRGNHLNDIVEQPTSAEEMSPRLVVERIVLKATATQHVKITQSKKGGFRGWKATWCFRDGNGWGSVHPFEEDHPESYESAYQWAIADLAIAAAKNNAVLTVIANRELNKQKIFQYIFPLLNSWQIVYVKGERYVLGRYFLFEQGKSESKQAGYEHIANFCAAQGHNESIPKPWRRLTRSQQRIFPQRVL
jgi:hypothetical protein